MPDVIAITPIDALPLIRALRDSVWLDVVRVVHLLGVSLLVGGILAFDLRILGAGRGLALRPLARHLLPVSVCGFGLAAMSGVVLFATRASELLVSDLFLAKLCIIFAMGANAVCFHLLPWKGVDLWPDGRAPLLARVLVALSVFGWIAVLACGVVLGGAT